MQTSPTAHSSIQFIIVYSYLMKLITATFIYRMSHNNHIYILDVINNHIHILDVTQQSHAYTGCHQYTFMYDFNWSSKNQNIKIYAKHVSITIITILPFDHLWLHSVPSSNISNNNNTPLRSPPVTPSPFLQ